MKTACFAQKIANERFYFFRENMLLLPLEIPDKDIQKAVNSESFLNELTGQNSDEEDKDIFSIPSLESFKAINAVMLYKKEAPQGWKEIPIRQVLSIIGGGITKADADLGCLLRAFHIGQWRKTSRFCGSCGTRNLDADNELARQCPGCGRMEFPRIAPAIITMILNDKDQALLAHNKKFAPQMYSLIAGYNEAGESLEATVAREIREEVNLEVKDIRYVCSQPWPFPDSLMAGFVCRHASGDIKADNIEIEDAQWFSRDKLPSIPGNGTVSRYLIELWLEGKIGTGSILAKNCNIKY